MTAGDRMKYGRLVLPILTALIVILGPTVTWAQPAIFLNAYDLVGQLTDVGGTLFFNASEPTNGNELWKSNGTPGGTVLVKDIFVGGDSSPSDLINVNGKLFFAATDAQHGRELWQSDGTANGTTVTDIRLGA